MLEFSPGNPQPDENNIRVLKSRGLRIKRTAECTVSTHERRSTF